jgi:hypothetical protein
MLYVGFLSGFSPITSSIVGGVIDGLIDIEQTYLFFMPRSRRNPNISISYGHSI